MGVTHSAYYDHGDVIVNHYGSAVSILVRRQDPVNFHICDDCGNAYLSPRYYTFDPRDCIADDGISGEHRHEGCTGNMCPPCAGSFIEPDDENDPRRPKEVS